MKTKFVFVAVLLVSACATKPPVAFLYKGMSKKIMLQIMGEPVQVVTTYQGEGSQKEEGRLYQFSNSKCIGETKTVCSVSATKDGVVYGWRDIKPAYTEDGQK